MDCESKLSSEDAVDEVSEQESELSDVTDADDSQELLDSGAARGRPPRKFRFS